VRRRLRRVRGCLLWAATSSGSGGVGTLDVMDVPPVRYLSTERGDIAHQCFGEGERTLVWTAPAWISIETRWDHPGDLRLWEFLASLGKVVVFDYRGFGISEHLPLDRVGHLDELSFDLGAIVEGLATAPTVLIATGPAGLPAIRFVASHPDAVERMVLLNATAGGSEGRTARAEQLAAEVRQVWGTGAFLGGVTSVPRDDLRRRGAAHRERLGATPAVAEAAILAQLRQDVASLLSHVTVPTLVVHTGDMARITREMTEAVAAGIPGAVYLSRPSSTFNWGEWDSDIKRFVTGGEEDAEGYRDLAALLFTDVVGSTEHAAGLGDLRWRETLDYLDAFVQREVASHQGRVVKQTGDGHLVEFARPGDALSAAQRLVKGAAEFGLQIRVGVHFAEMERRSNGDIGGIGVHVAARIAALAEPGEILVSRTVTELTTGSGRRYVDRGVRRLKGVPGDWQLYVMHSG